MKIVWNYAQTFPPYLNLDQLPPGYMKMMKISQNQTSVKSVIASVDFESP